jgi:REP element-mobilizing transposase RayT
MRAPRTHVPGIVYHVYARGVGGQDIVAGAEDWDELQALIAEVARACDVRLYAFGLMSNHYHLLLEVGQVSLSRFMQRIQTAWSRRFNIARGRWGHVFQDRFKHRVCDGDAYFKWLQRYMHLNPVKAGMVSAPEEWRWSSFRQYSGEDPSGLCEVDWPLSLFAAEGRAATEAFLRFVEAGKGETRPPRKLFDSRKRVLRPLRPRGSAVARRPPLEEVLSQAASSGGVPAAGIRGGAG